MDREGDDSRPSPTLHFNYPGVTCHLMAETTIKHGRISMVLRVTKDTTTRRRHRCEFSMTSIFGGGFPVVFSPKITDVKSENKHYITIDYD